LALIVPDEGISRKGRTH